MPKSRPAAVLKSNADLLKKLGIKKDHPGVFYGKWQASGSSLESISPVNGKPLGSIRLATATDYQAAVKAAEKAFLAWRMVPAPKRGEIIRQLGNALRDNKTNLGRLVTLEAGKIPAEGEGEVQEMIDICDFAVGLSRQLYGLTIASERPAHRMLEQWHPLGITGVITSFNFPVAVWAWNSALACVCGNSVLWKPSCQTPLTSIATTLIAEKVCRANGVDPAIFTLVNGDGSTIGQTLLEDRRVPLISATGSTRMGRIVGETVGKRLGRALPELGGNNAIIVTPSANMELAVRGIVFGAVGTAGQRCTSTRRVFAHKSVIKELTKKLISAYGQVQIGNPLLPGILMGPLINLKAVSDMQNAIATLKEEGGEILFGGETLKGAAYPGGCYVRPCIARAEAHYRIVHEETFAPILYIMAYDKFEDAVEANNAVPQGLSSAVFTDSVLESEMFLMASGSDCGIANVNIGTSGAEIGGAFGGEKETGGGRESGSDSWKVYMRRQTVTINGSRSLPLAQGIKFG